MPGRLPSTHKRFSPDDLTAPRPLRYRLILSWGAQHPGAAKSPTCSTAPSPHSAASWLKQCLLWTVLCATVPLLWAAGRMAQSGGFLMLAPSRPVGAYPDLSNRLTRSLLDLPGHLGGDEAEHPDAKVPAGGKSSAESLSIVDTEVPGLSIVGIVDTEVPGGGKPSAGRLSILDAKIPAGEKSWAASAGIVDAKVPAGENPSLSRSGIVNAEAELDTAGVQLSTDHNNGSASGGPMVVVGASEFNQRKAAGSEPLRGVHSLRAHEGAPLVRSTAAASTPEAEARQEAVFEAPQKQAEPGREARPASTTQASARTESPMSQPTGAAAAQGGDQVISRLKALTVMVAMVGRDVAHELPHVLRNVQRLSVYFKRVFVVLVENDSADDTKGVFTRWLDSSGLPGELVTLPPGISRTHKDLGVLAEARNAYLDLLSQEKYSGVEYLVVVDSDMCFPWKVSRIASAIANLLPGSGTHWHALYANGVCGWYTTTDGKEKEVPFETEGSDPIYCDLFALRDHQDKQHSAFDVKLFPHPFCPPAAVADLGCTELNGEPLVPVTAAFGGWGMYRTDVLLGRMPGNSSAGGAPCRYSSPGAVCEHVPLSACIREQGGRQFVVPRLVVNWEGCEGPVRDQ